MKTTGRGDPVTRRHGGNTGGGERARGRVGVKPERRMQEKIADRVIDKTEPEPAPESEPGYSVIPGPFNRACGVIIRNPVVFQCFSRRLVTA